MKRIEDLQFSDDVMFASIMNDISICKGVIECVTGREIAAVQYHSVQDTIPNERFGHEVRLDVRFVGDETVYDIEMQASPDKGLFKRTRYYQSSIDSEILAKGKSYENLRNTCIIFFCKFDPFGQGLAKYTVRSHVVETEQEIDFGIEVIYLSCVYNCLNCTVDLGKLLDYIAYPVLCEGDELVAKIEERKCLLQQNDSFRRNIMRFEEYLLEAKREGKKEGLQECLEKGLEKAVRAVMQSLGVSEERARIIVYGEPRKSTSKKLNSMELK